MHISSQHISQYVSTHLCQLSPHTNHQCSSHTVCGDTSLGTHHLIFPVFFHMGTVTFHYKPFLQDHHDFSAKWILKSITSKVLLCTEWAIQLILELQLMTSNNVTDPFATQQYLCFSFWTKTHSHILFLAKRLLCKVKASFQFVITQNVPPYMLKLILQLIHDIYQLLI